MKLNSPQELWNRLFPARDYSLLLGTIQHLAQENVAVQNEIRKILEDDLKFYAEAADHIQALNWILFQVLPDTEERQQWLDRARFQIVHDREFSEGENGSSEAADE